MSRLSPGMVVTVYTLFATREGPIGRAELVRRDRPNPHHPLGALRRGGQLESWLVCYLDDPPEGYGHPKRPEWATIRTDEPDLRPGAPPPPEDDGPTVKA
ncbi:MAG: hypothetical protein M3Q49_19050 [Actinomycetota bacterium]|nr:hypothetical protein [Actinomycetota bacterium]